MSKMNNSETVRDSAWDPDRAGPFSPDSVAAALRSNPADKSALVGAVLTATAGVLVANCQPGEPDGLLATRIICRLLANHGIEARPIPVQVALFNAAAVANMKRAYQNPTSPAMPDALIRLWGPGPGERFGRSGQEYLGHLVPLVDGQWLVDAAIAVASDPKHGFFVDALYLDVDRDELLVDQQPLDLALRGGGAISYEARPADESYKSMEGWTNDISRYLEAVEKLLEANGIRPRV
jgi:hypothetical protein